MFVHRVQCVPDVTQSPSSHSWAPQRLFFFFFPFRAPPSLPYSEGFTLFSPIFGGVICCAAPEPDAGRGKGRAHRRGASRGGGLGDPRPAGKFLLPGLTSHLLEWIWFSQLGSFFPCLKGGINTYNLVGLIACKVTLRPGIEAPVILIIVTDIMVLNKSSHIYLEKKKPFQNQRN